MAEIRRLQLSLVVYPIIYQGFIYISGGCLGFQPSTVVGGHDSPLKGSRELTIHIRAPAELPGTGHL